MPRHLNSKFSTKFFEIISIESSRLELGMRSREKRARCPSSSPPFHENEEAEEKHRACELDKHEANVWASDTP